MFFGRNESGASVNIDNSLPGHQYFCPVCGGELIRKMGHINVHHFAHKSRVECDDWYDTKGPWHRSMQAKFKEKFQEVPVVYQGETHIADVRFPRKNALPFVIEFQESPISSDEFYERTNFYKRAGNDILWVFNFSKKENIYQNSIGKYRWINHGRFLNDFDPKKNWLVFYIRPVTDWYSDEYDRRKPLSFSGPRFLRVDYQYQNYKYFGGKIMDEDGFKTLINIICRSGPILGGLQHGYGRRY